MGYKNFIANLPFEHAIKHPEHMRYGQEISASEVRRRHMSRINHSPVIISPTELKNT
jgi:hypothetical protein